MIGFRETERKKITHTQLSRQLCTYPKLGPTLFHGVDPNLRTWAVMSLDSFIISMVSHPQEEEKFRRFSVQNDDLLLIC